MTGRLAAILPLLGAGCTTARVIWSGHDPGREMSAEVLTDDRRQWLRTAGVEGARFDVVATDDVVFSAGSARLAYPAMIDGGWWMVIGKERLGPWENVAEPHFSSDGRRFAFLAKTADGWHAVVDGRVGRPFDAIQARTLQFSDDGSHLGFVGWVGTCAAVVLDEEVLPCHERIRAIHLTNPGTVAIVIREGSKERFLFGDQAGPAVDSIGEWTVSPGGSRYAYAARTGSRWTAFVDGSPSGECDRIQQPRFGDDDRRVAWVCRRGGRSSINVDGEAGPSWPVVSAPVLASRAPDHAYVGQDEQGAWVVTRDSMEGPFAEVYDLLLAPSGGEPFFVARSGGRVSMVHGSQRTVLSAPVAGTLVVSDDGGHWAIIDGDPSTRSLWLLVDGRRVRQIGAEEVFDERPDALSGWLRRELREALKSSRPEGGV